MSDAQAGNVGSRVPNTGEDTVGAPELARKGSPPISGNYQFQNNINVNFQDGSVYDFN